MIKHFCSVESTQPDANIFESLSAILFHNSRVPPPARARYQPVRSRQGLVCLRDGHIQCSRCKSHLDAIDGTWGLAHSCTAPVDLSLGADEAIRISPPTRIHHRSRHPPQPSELLSQHRHPALHLLRQFPGTMASSISTQACLVDQILPPIKSGSGRSLLRDNTSLKRLLSNAPPTYLQTTPTTQVERQATSPKHPPPGGEIEKKKQEEVNAKYNPSHQPPLALPSDKSTNAVSEEPGQLPRQLLGHFRRWRQESRHGRLLPRYISIIPMDQVAMLDLRTAWQPPLIGQPDLPGDVPPNLLQKLSTKAEGRSDEAQPLPSLPNSSLPPQKQAAEQDTPALPEHPDDDSDDADDAAVPWSSSPPTQIRRTTLASLAGSNDRDDPLSGTDGEDARDDLPPDSSPPQLPGFMKNKTTFLPRPRSQLKAVSERREDKDLHADKNEQNVNGIIDPHANNSPNSKDVTQPNHAESHKAPERRKSFKSLSQELGVDSPCVVIPELKESTVILAQDIHMGGATAHLVDRATQRIQVEQTPHTGKPISADQRAIQHMYQPARHRNHPADEPVSTACVPGTFDETSHHRGVGRSQPSPGNDPAVLGSGQETKLQHQTSTNRYDFAQNTTSPEAGGEAHGPSTLHASKPLASTDQRTESMQTGTQLPNQEISEDHEIGSSPPDHTILPGSSREPLTDTHGLIRPQSYVYTLPQSAKQSTSDHEFRRKRPSDEQDIRSFNKQPRTAQMLPSSSIWDPDLALVAQESRSHRREYLTKFKKPSIRREGSLISRVESSASGAVPRPMAGPTPRERMSSQSLASFRTSIPHSDEEDQATVRIQRTNVTAPQASQLVNQELFEEYQAAYSEYAGSLPHFQQAIQLLKRTSLSGKGFHPYLFDDAVFHHYHAYRAYKADEVDDCENAMSFHDFYNQRIMNPSHVSGLITLEVLRSGTSHATVPRSRKRQLSIESDENEISRDVSRDSEYGIGESWSGSQDRLMSHTQTPRGQLSRRRLGAESPDLGTPLPRQKPRSSVPRPDLQAARVSPQINSIERSKAERRSDPFPLSTVQTPQSMRKQMSKTPRTLPKTFTTTSSSLQIAAPAISKKLSAAASLESKAARSPSPILTKAKTMQQWWQEADTPFKRFERQMRSLPGEHRARGRTRSDAIDQGINIFTWRR